MCEHVERLGVSHSGVRWHAIPKHERDALWQRYQARCGEKESRA